MKISDFLPEKDYQRFKELVPGWEYSIDYSDSEIDVLDEELEIIEQQNGYETSEGIFIGDVINKLRTNLNY